MPSKNAFADATISMLVISLVFLSGLFAFTSVQVDPNTNDPLFEKFFIFFACVSWFVTLGYIFQAIPVYSKKEYTSKDVAIWVLYILMTIALALLIPDIFDLLFGPN